MMRSSSVRTWAAILLVPLLVLGGTYVLQARHEAKWRAVILSMHFPPPPDLDRVGIRLRCERGIIPATWHDCIQVTVYRHTAFAALGAIGIGIVLLGVIHVGACWVRRDPGRLARWIRPAFKGAVAGGAALAVGQGFLFLIVFVFKAPRLLGRVPLFSWGVLSLLTVFAAATGLLSRAARRALVRPADVSAVALALEAGTHPDLWTTISEVAAVVGSPVPDQILAGLAPPLFLTAAPVSTPERCYTGWSLYLPLPLLALLTESEFRAVLAHEFAHAAGRDAVWSRQGASLVRGTAAAREEQVIHWEYGIRDQLLLAADSFLESVERAWLNAPQGWVAQREVQADAIAARVTGTSALVRALQTSHLFADCWATDIHRQVCRAILADTPIPYLGELAVEAVRAARTVERLTTLGHLRLLHPTDTHPPLRNRIEALGESGASMLINEQKGDQTRQAVDLFGGSHTLDRVLSLGEQARPMGCEWPTVQAAMEES
jgi:Zn-dependent protease with chaperone function